MEASRRHRRQGQRRIPRARPKRSKARQMSNSRPTVSIVIKALNEERHVAAAIESALAALDGIDGEVILADSCSTDRTVAIAGRYPIKIVSLLRIEDRSCGAGVSSATSTARDASSI